MSSSEIKTTGESALFDTVSQNRFLGYYGSDFSLKKPDN